MLLGVLRLLLLASAGALCGGLVGALACLLTGAGEWTAPVGVSAVLGAGALAAVAFSASPSARERNRQDPPPSQPS